MVLAKKFVLLRHFQGEPKPTDFKLVAEQLPPLKEGEVLVEAEFLSVDPYMRMYVLRRPPGGTMIGAQVARVVESRAAEWRAGDRVVGSFGWRSHSVFDAAAANSDQGMPIYKLPDIGALPASLGLGVLGMPGNTAYFGLLELCKPKQGDTVVVSGAAGAVGSIVGQIAKVKGCRVVGFAGSDAKVQWLKGLGFDAAFNYKTKDVGEALKEAAPNGVDCFFDNVGGTMSSVVLNHMNPRGRVAVCGSISSYNADPANYPAAPVVQPSLVFKELLMEGFLVTRWNDRWMEGIQQNLKWIRAGKLKFEETVTKGFENMPLAFIGMLKGENTGKAVVQV